MLVIYLLQTAAAILFPTRAPDSRGQECFRLTNSVQCPSQNGLMIATTREYQTSEQFDEFVKAKTTANPDYIDQFKQDFQCPAYQGLGLQFQMTTYCSIIASRPPFPAVCNERDLQPPVPVCKETCDWATTTLSNVLKKNCLKTDLSVDYGDTLEIYSDHCSKSTVLNRRSGNCLDGSNQTLESNKCGNHS